MAIVQVSLGNTFEEWRQITNAALTAAGDMSTLYDVTKTDVVQALNDLNTRKLSLAGGTMTGALNVLPATLSTHAVTKAQLDFVAATAADDAFINALLFGG